MSIQRGYITLNEGAQVHYHRAGRLGAPSLVLLHQTPSTAQMYHPLMQALGEDFDMIALDTPGFGQSDPLPQALSIAAAGEVLSQALEQLVIGPALWFGHHTGAALALQIADAHPEQVAALALSGPCLLDQALRERLPLLASAVPAVHDGSHLLSLWQRMQDKDADAPLAIIQRETQAAISAGAANPQAYQAVVEVDTAAQLRALDCPTLVFAGTDDPLFPQLDAAHALLKRGQRAEIVGAKTFVCETHCSEVAALLRDFFGAYRYG